MRRLALAALAVLAACSVKLEGAPCASDANCPSEQRCDLGGGAAGHCVTCVPDPGCTADGLACQDPTTLRECRTSVAGCHYSILTRCPTPQTCQPGTPAACGCPPAGTGLPAGCSSLGAKACDVAGGQVLACASLGGCLVWQTDADCSLQALVCKTPAGQPVCACPDNLGTELQADAANGSASGVSPYPTGLATPTQCRFRKLGDALTVATAGKTVRMTGWSGTEVKFSSVATGESFPLQVKAGVSLTTADAPLVPAHYVVEVDQAGTAVLQLDHDAAASGFTIRPGTGGSASAGALVECTSPGAVPVAVSSLAIDGKGALAASAIGDGLHLLGTCSVSATSLVVENATGAGIRVETSFPMGGPAPSVSISSSTLQRNGDSGLVVNVDASNGKPSLVVTGNDVTRNSAATAHTDNSVTPNVTRRGGGVVLLAAAPVPLVFTGNLVHGNSYDQLLVYSSDPAAWTLSGLACDATSNVFTCYDATTPGGPYFGLAVLGGATVNALYDSWSHAVPAAGTDYYKTPLSTVNATPACTASTLTCP